MVRKRASGRFMVIRTWNGEPALLLEVPQLRGERAPELRVGRARWGAVLPGRPSRVRGLGPRGRSRQQEEPRSWGSRRGSL